MTLINSECLEALRTFENNSIDSIVTDPPYGFRFMSKEWDYDVPTTEFWREALRVLKPGGHVLSFGGTRTYHRLVVAIEDAGFEIRDQIQWLYGSGFPKSTNVALRIDKESGATGDRGAGFNASGQDRQLNAHKELRSDHPDYVPPEYVTDAAKQWQGWGTALKPANEPIVVARKPLEGTVAANVQKWGTGAINIDGSRIEVSDKPRGGATGVQNAKQFLGNIDGQNGVLINRQAPSEGRWPANIILDEDAAAALDEQSGVLKSGSRSPGVRKGLGYNGADGDGGPAIIGSIGGASRFFYVAKASKNERGTGNNHPTVKPIKLMTYLVKLVTPPNGTVLDPFMGSGTTGLACKLEGFKFIGIEQDADYFKIAEGRMGDLFPGDV